MSKIFLVLLFIFVPIISINSQVVSVPTIPDSLLKFLDPSDNISEDEQERRAKALETEEILYSSPEEYECSDELVLSWQDSIYTTVTDMDNQIQQLSDSCCMLISKSYRVKLSKDFNENLFSKGISDLLAYLIKNNMLSDKNLFITYITRMYDLKINQSVMLKQYSRCPNQKFLITNYIKGYRHLKQMVQERVDF